MTSGNITAPRGGGCGIARDLRREGVGRVDQHVNAFGGEIIFKALGAAEAAAAQGNRCGGGARAAGEGHDRLDARRRGEQRRQRRRLRRSAENKDPHSPLSSLCTRLP